MQPVAGSYTPAVPFIGSPQLTAPATSPGSIIVSRQTVIVLSIRVMTGIVSGGGITMISIWKVSLKPISSHKTTQNSSLPTKFSLGV